MKLKLVLDKISKIETLLEFTKHFPLDLLRNGGFLCVCCIWLRKKMISKREEMRIWESLANFQKCKVNVCFWTNDVLKLH